MMGLDALHAVQYVTIKGKRFAVVHGDDWEALVEWLETLEDVQRARETFADLEAAGNDRMQAGWLRWEDVEGDLG